MDLSEKIFIGQESLSSLDAFLARYSSAFIFTDKNVHQFCLPELKRFSSRVGQLPIFSIDPGEEQKNFRNIENVCRFLLDHHADRTSVLINLGGGVISDIGGFAAAVYKRGISYLNMPTTLLSMVDASIGGKTGINLVSRKNMVGAFQMPDAIFIYPDFTLTQDQDDYRSGFSEIIKHILLSDKKRWEEISEHPSVLLNKNILEELIHHSVQYKSDVTEKDFHETDERRVLNFGHTLGHAIESYFLQNGKPLKHGEAIALGMIGELFISSRLLNYPTEHIDRLVGLVKIIFPTLNFHSKPENIFPFLKDDKKNKDDRIAFVLMNAPGNPAGIYYPEMELINEGLSFMKEMFAGISI